MAAGSDIKKSGARRRRKASQKLGVIRLADAGTLARAHAWNLAFPIGGTAPWNGGISFGCAGATGEKESAGDSGDGEEETKGGFHRSVN